MAQPDIHEVIKAFQWVNAEFVNGKLEQLYPRGIPTILIDALRLYAEGWHTGQAKKYQRDDPKS